MLAPRAAELLVRRSRLVVSSRRRSSSNSPQRVEVGTHGGRAFPYRDPECEFDARARDAAVPKPLPGEERVIVKFLSRRSDCTPVWTRVMRKGAEGSASVAGRERYGRLEYTYKRKTDRKS